MRDTRLLEGSAGALAQAGTPLWPGAAPGDEPASSPGLSHYIWAVGRHKWRICAFVAACVLATVLISARLTPQYEATATIDIDRQGPTGVIGQEANRTTANDNDQFLATQVRLIQSDSVLRPVVQRLRLHELEGAVVGGETGRGTGEAPLKLARLKVHRPANTYLVLVSYRSSDPRMAANVANAVARSYLEHTWNIRYQSAASLSGFMEKQLEELRVKMERSGSALMQFEREMNVINPEERTSIAASRLTQLNTEYTQAQAERVRKQAAWDSARSGSVEAAQVSLQGEGLRRLAERLDDAREKFATVRTHFGANHPEYRRASEQVAEIERQFGAARENIARRVEVEYQQSLARERMLERAVSEQKHEMDRVNARSFDYQTLKREAEGDKQLYQELVQKIRQAGINAGFQNSSIRVADFARPPAEPASPNIPLNGVLAFLFSAFLALAAAIVSDAVDDTVRDPEQVSRTLRTEVIASLPAVSTWKNAVPLITGGASEESALVPANSRPGEALNGYAEAIRTLRNSLLLADFDRRMKSILITSASPGEGKSTAAAHLAMVHAQQGNRTLLIDGDLRRPTIAKRFEVAGATGLSNALTGEVGWRDALVQAPTAPNLDILPAGPPSRRAADLVGRGIYELLEEAGREYDLIVLDGPPLPGFAEPLQMAASVDGVIVVTTAGKTSRKAVAAVLASLQRLRVNVVGLVMNRVRSDLSESYRYYGNYSKYYQAEA